MIDNELIHELLTASEEAVGHTYSPYSSFGVGAALLCKDGSIYKSCNIENAAYSPSVCAERSAFFKAVYDGKRDFEAISIVNGKFDRNGNMIISDKPCSPCGVCRQVMAEFCKNDFKIYLCYWSYEGKLVYDEYTFEQLLPFSFGPSRLED